MAFKMRTTKPEKGNKYYITKAAGGWSTAIEGKPTDSDCNVLSNCVGYALGRFNEIGDYGCIKYLRSVNAENFIQYKGDLEVGQTPKVGACMVWRKGATLSGSDGAGHVAIVERVDSDTQVLTSESGWGNTTPFWTKTRTKGNGNWGQSSAYTFLGFIYNPAVEDEPSKEIKPIDDAKSGQMKYNTQAPLQCMMTQSTCYKGTKQMSVKGILWHSTGANNPWLLRYVQPDDDAEDREAWLKLIGTNKYKNDWNHIERSAGLNAWIGKLDDGTVATIQTMPWDYRPWGCGSGAKGSCNNGWIQFEICEDGLSDKNYFEKVYEEAAQLTAYLCKKYNIDPNGTVKVNGVDVPTILCHADSYSLKMGSNHGDINHWFPKFGKTMESARAYVAELLNKQSTKPAVAIEAGDLVSIAEDAVYYSGKTIPTWVKQLQWYVKEVSSTGRAVINEDQSGQHKIMSPIDVKYLTKISDAENKSESADFEEYLVKIIVNALNCRSGPGLTYNVNKVIRDRGVYTIVDESIDSSNEKWGKLKSGAGWIMLKYTEKYK